MGGTRDPAINNPSNLLHLCSACHMAVEVDRAQAKEQGHLVPNYGTPVSVPLLRRGRWVYHDDEGGTTRADSHHQA